MVTVNGALGIRKCRDKLAAKSLLLESLAFQQRTANQTSCQALKVLSAYLGSQCTTSAGQFYPAAYCSASLPTIDRLVYLQTFPSDYATALRQAQTATLAALEDGHKLIEVEFPTSSLQGVSGQQMH